MDIIWFYRIVLLLLSGGVFCIVFWEEFLRPRRTPVHVEPVPEENLENSEFAFYVTNNTATRISGGNKICIMPREIKIGKDKKEPKVEHITLQNLKKYLLTGNTDFLKIEEGPASRAMYCQFPAGLDPTSWRGLWATYLDPEGGDKKKKISNYPFPIYNREVERVVSDCLRTLAGQSSNPENSPQETINNRMDKIKEEFKRKTGEEPDGLKECVFPPIKIEDSKRVELVLKNIDSYVFAKKDGKWEKIKESV